MGSMELPHGSSANVCEVDRAPFPSQASCYRVPAPAAGAVSSPRATTAQCKRRRTAARTRSRGARGVATVTLDERPATLRVLRGGREPDAAAAAITAAALEAALRTRAPALHASTPLVRKLAVRVSRRLGLDEHEEQTVDVCAQLPDVGMIGLPDSVIFNTGPLSPADWALLNCHPERGARAAAFAAGHGPGGGARPSSSRAVGRRRIPGRAGG